MKKKEYIKPEISVIEMTESTSILAGSYGDTVKITLEDDFDEDDPNDDGSYGFGNNQGTGVWD